MCPSQFLCSGCTRAFEELGSVEARLRRGRQTRGLSATPRSLVCRTIEVEREKKLQRAFHHLIAAEIPRRSKPPQLVVQSGVEANAHGAKRDHSGSEFNRY